MIDESKLQRKESPGYSPGKTYCNFIQQQLPSERTQVTVKIPMAAQTTTNFIPIHGTKKTGLALSEVPIQSTRKTVLKNYSNEGLAEFK
jgi:hypothetical protein